MSNKPSTNPCYLKLPKVFATNGLIYHDHYSHCFGNSVSNCYSFGFLFINNEPYLILKDVLVDSKVTAATLIRNKVLDEKYVLRVRMPMVNIQTLVHADALKSESFVNWFNKTTHVKNKEQILPKFYEAVTSGKSSNNHPVEKKFYFKLSAKTLKENAANYYAYLGRSKQFSSKTQGKLEKFIKEINKLGYNVIIHPIKK